MRLELSREAQADLDDIRDYSVAQFGTGRAVAYLDAVERAFRRVLDFPEIGAVRPELAGVRSLGCQHTGFSTPSMARRSVSCASCTRRWMSSGGFEAGGSLG
ncbi:type II toxin-antitoxin system RelE/ParE family toxin [Sphingomonas gei]|uniref:Type II toxin-antitoxin system RelE/ParE family toxin n=1 Tax=Sphingomonas gei TaxID=1395960 RepID=A0A4S1XD59_9SPHN|nr:type II toxin-antitoxin system RelE/ParE family toxin [Sphingomonas gei]TGX53607.1 type II toxin-antitoxin system RelE/ParE family toxin [Sphingomonas gei]